MNPTAKFAVVDDGDGASHGANDDMSRCLSCRQIDVCIVSTYPTNNVVALT